MTLLIYILCGLVACASASCIWVGKKMQFQSLALKLFLTELSTQRIKSRERLPSDPAPPFLLLSRNRLGRTDDEGVRISMDLSDR